MVTFLLSMKPMHNSTSNGSADVVKRAYAQTRLSNKALARVPRSTKTRKNTTMVSCRKHAKWGNLFKYMEYPQICGI